jgi:hypothetical protein
MSGSVGAANGGNPNQKTWSLVELVEIAESLGDLEMGSPMQLLRWEGKNPEGQGPIMIVSGFSGAQRPDAATGQLLQKAIANGVFNPFSTLYFCPMANPTSQGKNCHLNHEGVDVLYDFPTSAKESSSDLAQGKESMTLQKWINHVKPIAVIALTSEIRGIHHTNCPSDIVEKIKKLSERDVHELGQYPELSDEEIRAGTQKVNELHQMDRALGKWVEENGMHFIQFSFDPKKKSFDDIREDWKSCVGPALKWLLDDPRFNPQEDLLTFALPNVVPTLDLPPELANLR